MAGIKIIRDISTIGGADVFGTAMSAIFWFYLNKQAAFANVTVLCDEADESSLGPIKVVLHSTNIEDVKEWLVSDAE